MRIPLFCLLSGLLISNIIRVHAQSIRTDPDPTRWINFAQTYYKIPIAETGIYRITTAELQQAGVPLNRIDPATLQLFHRGIEQAISITEGTDHRFGAADYLEFYGRGNDGSQDSLLYRPIAAQPHRFYSLFNDTTAYFLTWRLDDKPGKRMTAYTDTAYANLEPEAYHWAEDLRIFTDTYPGWAAGLPAKVEYSHYEAGEGYTGVVQQKEKPFDTVFPLTNPVVSGPKPELSLLLVGRDITNHRVDCWLGPTGTKQTLRDSVRFTGYTNANLRVEADWPSADLSSQLVVSTISRGEFTATDPYSVSYIRLRYPQKLTVSSASRQLFRLPATTTGRSLLDVTNGSAIPRFWDISDPTAPVQIGATAFSSKSVRLIVHGTEVERLILCTSYPKAVPRIQPVTFTDWSARQPNYLIISHQSLMQAAGSSPGVRVTNAIKAYAEYRASVAGGRYDTLTTTLQQLFDQYSYGERHPLAIRRFARQMLHQGKDNLPYLLLIGRSRSTPGIRRNPQQAALDMVMTAGFPGSDGLFSAGLVDDEPDVPALPTGRINAGTPQEVIDYLNKVKDYERLPTDALWRKNILHLSGGQTLAEMSLFRQLVDSYHKQAAAPSLGAQVTTFSKRTNDQPETPTIARAVNEGVGLITFFGHSGLDVTDLDVGFCSDDKFGYRNTGKYPFLLINGCAIGNFFFGRPTLATDWVLTPNRGAIAALAHSHLGYADVMHQYTRTFYDLLTDHTQMCKSLGQLQQETIRRVLAQTPDGRALANCQQMVLQGDPAIRLFPFQTPDYALTADGLTIQERTSQTDEQRPLTLLSDSVRIRCIVANAGLYQSSPLPVQVRRFVDGHEAGTFWFTLPQSVAYRDTLTLTIPNDHAAEGLNQFEVTINPSGSPDSQPETNPANNQATTACRLASPNPVLIYPPPGSIVKTSTVRLMAQYVSDDLHSFDLELDTNRHFSSPLRVGERLTGTRFISHLTPSLNYPNRTYYWRVRLADLPPKASPNDSTTWSMGSFRYAPMDNANALPEGQLQQISNLPNDSQQGDTVDVPVQFTNLSPTPFADSLIVQQTIYPAGSSAPQTTQWRIAAPLGSDTLRFTARIATEKLPGYGRLRLTVNPRVQPEYSFLNNTLDLPLFIQPDVVGPLLEVAFDGARIADGSVVSAQPTLEILVIDDNRALVRRDTTGLDLFLQRPGSQGLFKRLSWQNVRIQPTGADRVVRLRYTLPKLAEGLHQLRITARDVVGNAAVPFQISFRVVPEQKLTAFTLSPNPFREKALFSVQLTGLEGPEVLRFSLSDLGGRTVRHFALPARIGQNEWTWDGHDDAGQLLPAGVYLYTVSLLKTDGSDWLVTKDSPRHLQGRLVFVR